MKQFEIKHVLPAGVSIEASPQAYMELYTQPGQRSLQIDIAVSPPLHVESEDWLVEGKLRLSCTHPAVRHPLYLAESTAMARLTFKGSSVGDDLSAHQSNIAQSLYPPLQSILKQALASIGQTPPFPPAFTEGDAVPTSKAPKKTPQKPAQKKAAPKAAPKKVKKKS